MLNEIEARSSKVQLFVLSENFLLKHVPTYLIIKPNILLEMESKTIIKDQILFHIIIGKKLWSRSHSTL